MEKATIKYKNWGQLPIYKYWELRDILDHIDEYEGLDANISLLSVLTDVDEDTLLDMSIFDIEQLMSQIKYVFTKVPIHHVGYKHIVVDGEKYDVQTDFSKVTTAQYIDFNNFYTDSRKYYANILTTFILPHGKRYNEGYDSAELAKKFEQSMDIETAENCCFFFASLSMSSIKVILNWFTLRMRILKMRTREKAQRDLIDQTIQKLKQQKELMCGLSTLMLSAKPRG